MWDGSTFPEEAGPHTALTFDCARPTPGTGSRCRAPIWLAVSTYRSGLPGRRRLLGWLPTAATTGRDITTASTFSRARTGAERSRPAAWCRGSCVVRSASGSLTIFASVRPQSRPAHRRRRTRRPGALRPTFGSGALRPNFGFRCLDRLHHVAGHHPQRPTPERRHAFYVVRPREQVRVHAERRPKTFPYGRVIGPPPHTTVLALATLTSLPIPGPRLTRRNEHAPELTRFHDQGILGRCLRYQRNPNSHPPTGG